MIQLEFDGRIPTDKLADIIKGHSVRWYNDAWQYYLGKNPTIERRLPKDIGAPDNKVPVSYARKLVRTITGYMFKPGLIDYTSENEEYLNTLDEIFYENNEPVKTSMLGKYSSIYGVGYELHYTTDDLIPRFAKVEPQEVIPIYNFSLEPKLTAAVRHYYRGDTLNVEVYYPDTIEYYTMNNMNRLTKTGEEPHEYDAVPLVVYDNNEELLGDFEPIRPLIDAYDILMSDSMNEFDRFAWAYLILKGMMMDEEDAAKIKDKRILEFVAEGGAEFLTKDVPSDFIQFMAEWIRKEIHKQSHIPDFIDAGKTGDNLSGVAIDKLLYDFEFIAATKEALFRLGLYRRLDLIDTIIRKTRGDIGNKREVEITMHRNRPEELLQNAKIAQAFAGVVSNQTLIENLVPFADWQTEQERLADEMLVDVEAPDVEEST